MSNDMIPLVEVGQAEEAEPGTVASAMPTRLMPDDKNYASDEKVRHTILNEMIPILTFCREDRKGLEGEWDSIRRMELMTHDEGQKYFGRSKAYVPVYVRILQTLVSSLSRGLFPSDEYMDVADLDGNIDMAKATKGYLQWEFDHVAKLRRQVKLFLRPYQNFGISVLKHRYKKDLRSVGVNSRVPDIASVMQLQPSFKLRPNYEGLHVSSRDPYHWYVYPTTIDTLDEARVIFEDIDVPVSFMKEMAYKRKWENVQDALERGRNLDADAKREQRLREDAGMTNQGVLSGNELSDVKGITEIWCFMVLPRDAYLQDEDPRCPIPVRAVICNDVILEVRRNPFWHQRPPYEAASQNASPGFFYGYGAGRVVKNLQYLTNDFANQTNDVGIFGLNPITKANPGLMTGPMRPIAPGVTYYGTDVKNMLEFDRPPVEIVQYGLQMMQTWMGSAQDFGGAPPVLQGIGAGKAAKTATGAQILQRNASQPLQDIVEDLEQQVFVPLMLAAWFNAQQYRDGQVMTMVAGEPIKVPIEQLLINPSMRWLASNQAASSQMRAQQAMQFMQAVLPIIPILMQQGYVVNFEPLLKRVYTDGLSLRGFEQFITKAQAMPGGPMGPGAPVQPGVMAEQGDRVRSALEQIPGMGGAEPVAGEGDEFMAVRGQADALAAMLGSQGGYGEE